MKPAIRTWGLWIVSVAIAVGLLAYLLSGIDRRALLETLRRIAPGPLLAFATLMMTSVLVRALRFWLLLGRTVPMWLLVGITLVRNLFVDLLPARLGELSFVYLITNRAKRPVEDGLAVLVLAFLLDAMALAPLLLLALLFVGLGGSIPVGALVGAGVAVALIAAALLRAGAPAARASARVLDGTGRQWAHAIAARGRLLADALERPTVKGVLLPAFALSVVLRLAKYGAIYCLALAIAVPLGYTAGTLGFFRVFLAAVSAELAAALPIHGVAGFGSYEAAWTFSFVYLGMPREHAVVSGILSHAIGQAAEYVLGAIALVALMRPRRVS